MLLEVLPAAELVPPPTLVPARILRPVPTTIDQAGTILTAPPRIAQNDLNGARRWGMSRGAAILLFGFAIAFGTYVSITQRDVALVKWRKVLYHNEAPALPPGIGNNLPGPPTSVPLVALVEREIENTRAEDARDAQLAQNDLTKESAAASQKPAVAAVQKPRVAAAAVPAPVASPPHSVKPKAPVVASVAPPSREHANDPRVAEAVVSKPVEKTIPKPPDKPLVVTTAKPAAPPVAPPVVAAAKPAAPPAGPPIAKAEAPQPQPRPSVATEPSVDAIQRAAQACDKEDGTGCIHRQLTKPENLDRIEKAEQTAVLNASSAEPKAPVRERVTRGTVRAAAPASAAALHAAAPASAPTLRAAAPTAAPALHAAPPAAASAPSAAPTLFDAARKVVGPESAASAVRESAVGPAGESPSPKAAPAAVPPQRFAALTEDINRLYRGH
ncbi:hypothetical protein AAHK20_06690 [Trinickia sp. YCB016]